MESCGHKSSGINLNSRYFDFFVNTMPFLVFECLGRNSVVHTHVISISVIKIICKGNLHACTKIRFSFFHACMTKAVFGLRFGEKKENENRKVG